MSPLSVGAIIGCNMAAENNESNEFDESRGSDNIELDKIELSKIELSKIPQQPVAFSVSEKPAVPMPPKEPELKPKGKKRLIAIIAVSVILFLVAFFFPVLKPVMIFSRHETGEKVGPYRKIDPIITNLDENRRIKILLFIRTAPARKEFYEILEARIRDGVLTFLVSTEIKKIIQLGDFKRMEAAIHKELTVFLDQNYMDQTFIKALKVYN